MMDSDYFELWEEEFEKREDRTPRLRSKGFSSEEAPRWRKIRKGLKDQRRRFRAEEL